MYSTVCVPPVSQPHIRATMRATPCPNTVYKRKYAPHDKTEIEFLYINSTKNESFATCFSPYLLQADFKENHTLLWFF